MFRFIKRLFSRKRLKDNNKSPAQPVTDVVEPSLTANEQDPTTLFKRLQQGLGRTRSQFSGGFTGLFNGTQPIDEDLLEAIENQLLSADVGVNTSNQIIAQLRQAPVSNQNLYNVLAKALEQRLQPVDQPLQIDKTKQPYVILVLGVNGVGKTTSIGKLARRFQQQGQSVMLAAGDTFRAAAIEQLQLWGQRQQIPVIAQHSGADSASVIFDGLQAAKARNIDVLIADTAGRLHNKSHLLNELSKIKRVLTKIDPQAPHETLLVLDAGTGQNALSQAKHFNQAVGVTGIVLTKLDGTAKGGIIFAIADQLGIPVRFIGVGEQAQDLQPFIARDFVSALLDQPQAVA
jgi:fused signal recognition particle receptor